MDVVSIPKRELGMLRAFFPEVEASLRQLDRRRADPARQAGAISGNTTV